MDPLILYLLKEKKDIEFKDTLVTILIDNSGSMRGKTDICSGYMR